MKLRSRRAALFAGTSLLMLAATVPALSQNINTMPDWNGTTFISSWGVPNTATYGQTITTTTNQRTLRNFTFQLSQTSGAAPNYRAHVYAWDAVNSRITGSSLYSSSILTAPTTPVGTFSTVSIDTGSTALTAGQQYVLLLTTSGLGAQAGSGYRYGSVGNNTAYAGGQFVFRNNGEDFSLLASSAWSTIAQDLAFTATFNNVIDTLQPFYLSSALAVDLEPDFQGGTLRLNTTSITQNFNVGAVAGNTIDQNGQTATFSGILSGTGGLTIISGVAGGSVSFTGANTYTGGTTITSGTLRLGTGGSLAATGALTVNGGIFDLNGATQTIGALSGSGGTLALGAGALTVTEGGTSIFAGVITGSGTFTKAGAGTLTLSGANTYTGGTTINAGTLTLSGGAALDNANAVTVNAGGTLNVLNSERIGSIAGAGNISIAANQRLVTMATANTTVSGAISGQGGLAVWQGGRLTLTGANTFSGGVTIASGTVVLGHSSALGTGAVTTGLAGFEYANGISIANAIALNGAIISEGGLPILIAPASLSNAFHVASGSATQSGAISGAGGITKTGTGFLTLTGANTYGGGTNVAAGALILGTTGNTAAITGTVTVATGAGLIANFANLSAVTGITTNGGTVQFNNSVTLGAVAVTNTAGAVSFNNTASAGSATIATTGTATNFFDTTFNGTSTAGNATFNTGVAGRVFFSGSSTLGTATINNSGTVSTTSYVAGYLLLITSGTITTPTIVNNSAGITFVRGATNLGSASITNNNGGITLLSYETPSAGNATIVNNNGGITSFGMVALNSGLLFGNKIADNNQDVSGIVATAANASIINNSGGATYFFAGSSGGSATIVNNSGGTLDISGLTTAGTTLAALSGGGNVFLGSKALTLTGNGNATIGGVIANGGIAGGTGGSLVKNGTGTLIVTGDNSYTGGTTIGAGTLQVGNGGAGGAVGSGNIVNNAALAFNRSDNLAYAGVISGTGAVTKAGAGTLTFAGANTYTGATTVTGGTLAVNGSIASGTTVASGGTLGGTGTVRGTTIQSGGTLAAGNSVGTLTVNGNLALQAGSTFAAEVNPTAADRVNVSGTASVAGNLVAAFQAGGGYAPASYTLLSSTGGLSGTFASFNTVGLPGGIKARLNYDASNVYLLLERSELTPLLGGLGTINQVNLAGGIDRAVLAGATPSASFQPLYNLTGTALGVALNQLNGQINAQISQAVSNNFFPFLQLLMGEGGTGGNGMGASFAPGKSYADADAPKKAQLASGELKLWGAVFGGGADISASAATGAQSLDASGYRFVAGASYALEDGLLLGASIAGGQDDFESGNGRGRSGDFALGFHAHQSVFDSGYLSAAVGFGWTSVKTDRIVTVSGTDVLRGKLDADTIGGRIEGGYMLALDERIDLTPFAAFAGESFETPAYTESAIGGSNAFALSYQANSRMVGHTELGARLGHSYALESGALRIEAVVGWMHSFDDDAVTLAAFQNLAGSSFQIFGVNAAQDSAILGLSLEGQTSFGLLYGLKLDSRLGDGSTIVTGTGRVGWRL